MLESVRRVVLAAAVGAAALLVATATLADIDASGRWVLRGISFPSVPFPYVSVQQWTQTGTSLASDIGVVGSIDPVTGVVIMTRLIPVPCNRAVQITATVTADGLSVTGSYSAPDSVLCTHHGEFAQFIGSRCPSGTAEPGEGCDDGNTIDGDGCNNRCNVEVCWACSGTPSVCVPGPCEACGNGVIDPGEACDDGNTQDSDGCSHLCAVEPCRQCFGEPSFCQVAPCGLCGDGVVEVDEECDDGNSNLHDGCDYSCRTEACWRCSGAPSTCSAFAEGAPCESDTSSCTVNGTCAADHRCIETPDLSLCDDGDPCTTDQCSTTIGCYHDVITCNDYNTCTTDQCVDGVCHNTSLCDDGNPCTADTCTNGCAHAPIVRTDCRAAGMSTLVLGDGVSASDTLKWTAMRSVGTSQDFADPRADASYRLCVFAGADNAPLASSLVPPDTTRWQSTRKGFRYRSRDASPSSGLKRVDLVADDADRAKIVVKGQGAGLHLTALPAALPIKLQWLNSQTDVCWEAHYGAADVRQRGSRLKAGQ